MHGSTGEDRAQREYTSARPAGLRQAGTYPRIELSIAQSTSPSGAHDPVDHPAGRRERRQILP